MACAEWHRQKITIVDAKRPKFSQSLDGGAGAMVRADSWSGHFAYTGKPLPYRTNGGKCLSLRGHHAGICVHVGVGNNEQGMESERNDCSRCLNQ
jgi:hypothetical protein